MVANVDDSRDDEDEEIAEDLEDDLLIDHLEDEIEEAPATNLHFIKRRKNSTGPLPLEVDSVSNKIVGLESKAFPRLVGREVALHVPGHHPSWANVPEQYEHLILTKLRHYYQLDSHPKLVAISIAEMAKKYKTRKNIRLQHFREYYKNPEDFENAVKNPPNELNEDQWRLICELFTTFDFIQRSKQNSINRQKMKFSSTTGSVTRAEILRQKQGKGYIETWKECHTKKDTNTFINEAAKNKYEEMLTTQNSAPESSQVSELEILRKTLGERRGHQRGVGRNLKGQSSGRCSQPATADQPDLRETVVELQKQIQTLTQQMSRERREPMDVEMNDAAPTQPIRPQPSHSQMGFNAMGFQQPHQTPTSFQQLQQQPLLNVQRTNDSPTIVDVPQSSEMVANVDDSRNDEDEEIAEDLEDDLLIDHLEDEIEEAPASNLHFIKRRKNSTGPLPLEVDSVSNKIVGLESKAFPRLVGREVALHVPGHHPSWANVPEQYEHLTLTKLRHYYQLDSHPKLVAISIAEMAKKYKTRKNIRLQHFREYYKNPEDFENAVKNPPNELNEGQWRLICELFTTFDFIQRSKQNSINRQKMKFSSTTGSVTRAEILRQKQGKGYIETWKECHTKKDTNTFINEAAKNKYEEMLTTQNSAPESSQVSELEILRKTLGERRGHQRGVGRNLKGQSSGRCSQPATADQPDLRETVVELHKQIQTLTQQMSRERREPMDVEMNDAAPTQPIRPQPSHSQMGFNAMGFQQPHQTPTSFQQLQQQPLRLFNNDIVVIDNNINNDDAVVNALRT
ncbi:hypothetical protein G4B88_002300 [Cannabis sativa]|nr:hypothetical protein G4B88_002300 [Cannabis sativa]